MKILMVASEIDGIVKTGGLADFAAALPKTLIERGHDVRVILPKYKNSVFPASVKSEPLYFNLNHSTYYGCLVHHANLGKITIRLVEHHDFFSRDGIYDDGIHPYQDNAFRYGFFCKAALEQCLQEQWIPDIIHCNDWQTAILPYYLKEHYSYHPDFCPEFKNTKTILTIHNGEYQGLTDKKWLEPLGIMPERFTSELMEEYGFINLLKCGIMYADAVNAVSPGYSQELLKPESSHQNLWHYLNSRRDNFTGILNGCDYTLWNPETDPFIPHHFSAQDMAGKALCKSSLQSRMGLPSNMESSDKLGFSYNVELSTKKDIPLFGLVSRLVAQKGFDYLLPALERVLYEDAPVQIAILGSGEHYYGSWIHHLERRYPEKMSFVNGYDNVLSHLIEAGSDFFMMPSLFEPCGLNQLYSLAYGTIPIIRETGGLKDTVIPLTIESMIASQAKKKVGKSSKKANLSNTASKKPAKTTKRPSKTKQTENQATGISFGYPDSQNCYEAIKQAVTLYLDYKPLYFEMQQRAMEQKFTWDASAKQYEVLYRTIMEN
ncbi:MAG: glycogen synthase [Desulfamplus sp.]|nr:glycogen synthase [Desulfamplus sp.]MBF0413147.1 glycogen synthase [Desulfamplus sp.]